MLNKKYILGLSIILTLIVVTPILAVEGDFLFTLDEIVVTASRYPVELSKTPVSMEVVSEEELVNSSAESVAEILNDITGINIIDQGGPAGLKSIHLRGSNPAQVLILLDGQPINNSQNGQTDLGQLPLVYVKRIEVLKGPASAIYGANALGGVVNIITKESSGEPQTFLKLAYGSNNTNNLQFNYSTRQEETGYYVGVNKKSSAGHRKTPDNSGFEQLVIFTKINHQLNNNSKLIFTLNYNESDKDSPGMLIDNNSDGDYDDLYDSKGTPKATMDDLDKNLSIKWIEKKSYTDTAAMIYYNQHENIYDDPDQWGYSGSSRHTTNKTGIELNRTNYLEEQTITYGLEVKNNEIDSNENGQRKFINKAIYFQDEWEVKEPIKITLGLRYDNHVKFGSELSPRFGTVYSLNDSTNMHISVGKSYRTPTFNDLYWPADAYTEGNSDLKPERGVAYEAGIINLQNGRKTEVNIFKKKIEDLIEWAAGDDWIYRPYNLNNAVINGAELIYEKQLQKNLSFNMNYTYLDAKNQATGEKLSGEARHFASLGLNYSKNDYKLRINSKYVGERADETLKDYIVVNSKISKLLILEDRNIEFALTVKNLLDEEYQVNKGYPMPGRNYMLEISIDF